MRVTAPSGSPAGSTTAGATGGYGGVGQGVGGRGAYRLERCSHLAGSVLSKAGPSIHRTPPNYMLCASEVGVCRTVFGVFLPIHSDYD